ncbi:hypothetical protein [Agromyces sp. ZXT2-6]|uniref:hypothetical protein n=1 Tax=Agromyces sp. ZXT2-6 TaxID=3461153 RepID=UPI004055151E
MAARVASGFVRAVLVPDARRWSAATAASTTTHPVSLAVGTPADPASVVDALMRALDRDRTPSVLVTGLVNRLGAAVGRYAPRRLVLAVAARAIDYEPAPGSASALTRTS